MESLLGEIILFPLNESCVVLQLKKKTQWLKLFSFNSFPIVRGSNLGFPFVSFQSLYLGVQKNMCLSTINNLLTAKILLWYTQHLHQHTFH